MVRLNHRKAIDADRPLRRCSALTAGSVRPDNLTAKPEEVRVEAGPGPGIGPIEPTTVAAYGVRSIGCMRDCAIAMHTPLASA